MKQIITFLKKAFDSLDSRITLSYGLVAHYLAKVAKSNSYVETFSRNADSLHKWIKSIYEVNLRRAFELQVRKAIKRLRVYSAELAFDITKEPFYGKTRNLHIINCAESKPYRGEFHYITCCLINRNKQIPLMALPVRYGEQTKLTIDLLKYCLTLFKRIKYTLFDRGFYRGELIDFLEAKGIRYLIFVPVMKGKLRKLRDKTNSFAMYRHTIHYTKAKSKWKPSTMLVVCKNIFGYDWLFATNIQLQNAKDYVLMYKRRWQIETNYRVEDEARIMSKSCNYLVRYFYFLVSLVFHIFWIANKQLHYYVPFKRFLDIIENKLLYRYLGIVGL